MEPPEPYVLGDLAIDYVHLWVMAAGEEVQFTATEYGLLAELSVNAGRVATHNELLQRVWGPANYGSPRNIRIHLMRLRHKLGEDCEHPSYIFSKPRVGYRIAAGRRRRATVHDDQSWSSRRNLSDLCSNGPPRIA